MASPQYDDQSVARTQVESPPCEEANDVTSAKSHNSLKNATREEDFRNSNGEHSTPQQCSPCDSRVSFSTSRCKPAGTIGGSAGGRGEGRSHVVLDGSDFIENHPEDAGQSNHNYRIGPNNTRQYPTSRSAHRASSAPIRKQSDRVHGHQGAAPSGSLHTVTGIDSHRRGVCVPVSTGCEQPLGHSRRSNIMHTGTVTQSQGHSCGPNIPPRAGNARKTVDGVDSRQAKSSGSLPGLPVPRGAPRQAGLIFPGYGTGSRPGSRESGEMGSRWDARRPRPLSAAEVNYRNLGHQPWRHPG